MCGKHLAKRKKNRASMVVALVVCIIVAAIVTEVISFILRMQKHVSFMIRTVIQ